MRAAVLFIALATLSACQAETALEREQKVQEKAAALTGWDRLFGSAQTTIASANQFGFRAPALEGQPGAYRAAGSDIFISSTAVAAPNKASFAAQGASPEALDVVTLGLLIQDPANAETAKQRFATLVRDFLFQAKAPGAEAIATAIAAEQPASGMLADTKWTLARAPHPGVDNGRRLTVTFTRADTKSATSSN